LTAEPAIILPGARAEARAGSATGASGTEGSAAAAMADKLACNSSRKRRVFGENLSGRKLRTTLSGV
jgi:hypothetical protein